MRDILHAHLEEFWLRVPDNLAISLIDGDETAIEIGQGDAARRLGKNRFQPCVTLCQSSPRIGLRRAVGSMNAYTA